MVATLVHDPVVVLALRLGLALLFASAAGHKLGAPRVFLGVLHAYRLLPPALVPAGAIVVTVAEIVVAIALLLPATRALGAAGAIALLAVYSGAIAINLWRGRREIDCGCGAAGGRQPINEGLLARNAVLALAVSIAARPVGPRPLVWIDGVTLVAAIAVAAAVWTAAHGLAAAAQRVRPVGASR